MAKDNSFDVVSEVDRQEITNALDQTHKELAQRYDFKGTGASIEWTGDYTLEAKANADQRLTAAIDVFKERLVKRSISLKALSVGEIKPAAGGTVRAELTIAQGIPDEKARAIVKAIKTAALKGVQVAIQGEQLRVSGKSRDLLQSAMALLKEEDFGLPLQFTNYR